MAHAIPKIEYKVTTANGDTTISNGTISNIADTTDIEVGQYVRGTGIPAGATVASKTSTSVTLAGGVLATASATVSIDYYYKIEFTYPPIEKKGEAYKSKERRSESLSGITQVSIDFIEGVRDLKFSFLSETLKVALELFFTSSGVYSESFRYYEDKTTTTYKEYELKILDFDPERIKHKISGSVWVVPVQMRRVL